MAINPKYLDKNLPPEDRAKRFSKLYDFREKASQLKYDSPAIGKTEHSLLQLVE